MALRGCVFIIICVVLAASTNASIVNELSVTREGGMLIAEADFIGDADRERVVRAFKSFDDLERLNPAILSSESIALDDGRFRVTTHISDCIALFCRSLTLVELVSVRADGSIAAEIDPSGSDFRSGSSEWNFESVGAGTRVTYRSAVRPDFWMPPLVGRHAMRKALERQIIASVANLEAMR